MVTTANIIQAIETRQPVLNKHGLLEHQLQRLVDGIAPLDNANKSQLSFIANARYVKALNQTKAGIVIVDKAWQTQVPKTALAIVVASPYLAYASCSQLFEAAFKPLPNHAQIHPTAIIADNAQIGAGVQIGAYCVLEQGVRIGAGTKLASHVSIGANSVIGKACLLYPQVVIGHHCQLGNDVRIHAHASIGSEGFGFAPTNDPAQLGWERIAQLGRVIIGNGVRIGSQTCIDRGAIENTVIEDNVIIDNLVQVAHNVHIGAGTAIAAKTGIAGSTTIGKRCIIGGDVGIIGHLTIADDVTLTAMTLVTKSIKKAGSYSSGTVAMPTEKWKRAAVRFRQLD